MKIIMRGNSVMETQYYLLYKDDDSSVSNSQLFSETNYIGLFSLHFMYLYIEVSMDNISPIL